MPDKFVTAPPQPLNDVGARFEDHRVDVMCSRQAKLVEEVQIMPKADAIAVVAPRKIAVTLGGRNSRGIAAEPRTKGEIFDVAADSDGEPGALRPLILRSLVDRHV